MKLEDLPAALAHLTRDGMSQPAAQLVQVRTRAISSVGSQTAASTASHISPHATCRPTGARSPRHNDVDKQ